MQCKIQASKSYIKSLPQVLKDKRSCFFQGERSAVQLPLDRIFARSSIKPVCLVSLSSPLFAARRKGEKPQLEEIFRYVSSMK